MTSDIPLWSPTPESAAASQLGRFAAWVDRRRGLSLGTDYDAVSAAVERADTGAGAVVLYDLGSAQMTAEMVVEALDDPGKAVVVDAPLVEGAVAAAVAAQGGADRAGVARAASEAGGTGEAETTPAAPAAETGAVRTEFTLDNEAGLHARPAALLVRAVAGVEADVDG